MSALAFIVHALALVLAVAGSAKLADPSPVARSLALSGLPASPLLGRLLGVGEVSVGGAVLAAGGALPALVMGLWYLGFVAFLMSNRLRGLHVPCGCIGDNHQPAGPAHLVLDIGGAVAAIAAVIWPVADATVWLDHGVAGWLGLVGILATSAAVVVLILRS